MLSPDSLLSNAMDKLQRQAISPLDVRVKGLSDPTATVPIATTVQKLLWNMKFNGTWVFTIIEQLSESSDPFECIRKERDAAKISICLANITYRGFLTPPRRYNITDIITKLRQRNKPKKKPSVKETKIARLKAEIHDIPKPEPSKPELLNPIPESPTLESPTSESSTPESPTSESSTPESPTPESSILESPTPESSILEQPKIKETVTMPKFNTVELASIKDLTDLFMSGIPGKINWFFRKMYEKPQDFKNEVWHQLKKAGFVVENAQKRVEAGPVHPTKTSKTVLNTTVINPEGTKTRIDWTDAEWDHLADLVESMRRNNPEPPLSCLITRALAQFPKERRRKLTGTKQMEPLVNRLKERYQTLTSAKDDLERLLQKVAEQESAPSKQEILESLTDDEIVQNFSQRVLDALVPAEIFAYFPTEALLESIPNSTLIAYTIQKILEGFSETSNNFNRSFGDLGNAIQTLKRENKSAVTPSIPVPRPIVFNKKPRVTVVGMIGDQPVALESRLAGRANFNFMDKDQAKTSIPSSSDIVVFWARFCSHKIQNQIKNSLPPSCRLITHHGGIHKLAETLDAMLPKYVSST